MRLLSRNKQNVWYANPTSIEYVTDANGLRTGEKINLYAKPVKVKMSLAISSGANNLGSQGMAELEPYGLVTGYTHRAITEDLNCTMGEESIIWLDEPTIRMWAELSDMEWRDLQLTTWRSMDTPYRFRVVRKTQSLNHLIFYLKEVDVG